MRLRVALPLLACAALAACGHDAPASTPAANQMSNELLDPAKEIARRWGAVFTDPAIRARAASELGYKIGAMQAVAGGTVAAVSDVQIVRIEKSPVETRTTMEASGKSAQKIDRYTFRFEGSHDDGRDSKAASDVDKTPLRVLMGFLQRFDVQPDDEIKVAFKTLKPIHKALPGATIDFVPQPPADPKRPRNRRAVFTITRPGVVAPAPVPTALGQNPAQNIAVRK